MNKCYIENGNGGVFFDPYIKNTKEIGFSNVSIMGVHIDSNDLDNVSWNVDTNYIEVKSVKNMRFELTKDQVKMLNNFRDSERAKLQIYYNKISALTEKIIIFPKEGILKPETFFYCGNNAISSTNMIEKIFADKVRAIMNWEESYISNSKLDSTLSSFMEVFDYSKKRSSKDSSGFEYYKIPLSEIVDKMKGEK